MRARWALRVQLRVKAANPLKQNFVVISFAVQTVTLWICLQMNCQRLVYTQHVYWERAVDPLLLIKPDKRGVCVWRRFIKETNDFLSVYKVVHMPGGWCCTRGGGAQCLVRLRYYRKNSSTFLGNTCSLARSQIRLEDQYKSYNRAVNMKLQPAAG